jgi:hypothetical protein
MNVRGLLAMDGAAMGAVDVDFVFHSWQGCKQKNLAVAVVCGLREIGE